jgi:exodeoxyribonuclease-3
MAFNILSWNVAGIRAVFSKDNLDWVNTSEYDVLCFQETKAEEAQVTAIIKKFDSFPYKYWNATKKRKGLHGTSIWCKSEPLSVRYGLLDEEFDQEGRVITVEMDDKYIVTVYTPNSKSDFARLDYRTNEWDVHFKDYVCSLSNKKVIICGDLNVCHQDIDIYEPKLRNRAAGLSDSERKRFTELLESGFTDCYRMLHNEKHCYTYWPYVVKLARQLNLGWRLDYFIISSEFADIVKSVKALPHRLGSDHCPIEMSLSS